MPLKADDPPTLVPKFSFGSKLPVDFGGEESKFNQNKNNSTSKAKPRTKEDVKNKNDLPDQTKQRKKEDVKNDDDLPVLDENGTTYNDIIRWIEKIDAMLSMK